MNNDENDSFYLPENSIYAIRVFGAFGENPLLRKRLNSFNVPYPSEWSNDIMKLEDGTSFPLECQDVIIVEELVRRIVEGHRMVETRRKLFDDEE